MPDGTPTMGVEEEFLLVNPRTGHASPCAEPVLARYRHHGPLPRGVEVHRELRLTQIEAASGVCATADELRHQLTAARRVLAGAAAAEDCALLAIGTPVGPVPAAPPPEGTGRYAEIDAAYGAVVADYDACGCHVHVGVEDPDTAVAVVNHLGRRLPTLLGRAPGGRLPALLRRGWATGAWAGVGTGVATALAFGPCLFIAYFAVTRQWRAALTALGTAVILLGGAAVIAPGRFLRRSAALADPLNQSLAGVLARLYNSASPPVLI